jgi:multiple antibiotic resistance protein
MSLLNTAVGLFTIANPIGNLPIYLSFATGRRGEDLALARACALTVATTLLLACWLGPELLGFFGIRLGAFQAAGGLILLLIGLAMLRSQTSRMHHDSESEDRDQDSASRGIVPLGIPLMAGPGTMTLVIASPSATSLPGRLGLSGVVLVVSVLIYLVLAFGDRIGAHLSSSVLQVITKVMGLLLTAIAMEMLFSGLARTFPVLASSR